MATDLETGAEATVTQLVSGILGDARELVRQQLALLRCEARQDLRTAWSAACLLIGGLGTALVASILCGLMLVHLLSWTVPELPFWVCYGLVGTPIAALAGGLVWAGIRKFESMNLLPDQSVRAFQENVRWKTNRK
jgi:hypothetical protein